MRTTFFALNTIYYFSRRFISHYLEHLHPLVRKILNIPNQTICHMRNILVLTVLFASQAAPAQERLVGGSFEEYYDWFHERSQVHQLYSDQATLYVFADQATLRQGPCQNSKAVAQLGQGHPVYNIAYNDEYYLPEDEINGYRDIWYHVKARDAKGRRVEGYLWGGHIAKGWRTVDISGDGRAEFLMLGLCGERRKAPKDIKAEIRILSDGKLLATRTVPGLCVFEECDASPLLQVFRTQEGFTVIEASTMTIGCWASVEKAFHYWDGQQLNRVYHAELISRTEYANEVFTVNQPNGTQICRYSHEGEDRQPVWSCKYLGKNNGRASADPLMDRGDDLIAASR